MPSINRTVPSVSGSMKGLSAISSGRNWYSSAPNSRQWRVSGCTTSRLSCGTTAAPGAYARTATQALTNVTGRYVEMLADLGLKGALIRQPALLGGINLYDGKIACQAVAEAPGMEYHDPKTLLAV